MLKVKVNEGEFEIPSLTIANQLMVVIRGAAAVQHGKELDNIHFPFVTGELKYTLSII